MVGQSVRRLVLALLLALPARLPGQTQPDVLERRVSVPAHWTSSWSPLAHLHDGRTMPPHAELPGLLLGAPRVGAFWTAGNPATLASDARDAYGEIRFQAAGEDGAYRRPLDDGSSALLRFESLRWQPLGENSAVAGRAVVDRVDIRDASFSPSFARHSSDPFVQADTTNPDVRDVRVRLEGAYGYRWREWGVGVAFGLDVRDARTSASGLPRIAYAAAPGVTAGLARTLLGGRYTVSAYGRWADYRDRVQIVAVGVEGVVYPLQGYSEPDPISFVETVYNVESTRNATAIGAGVTGTALRTRWTAFAERVRRSNKHARGSVATQPNDTWDGDGWHAGGAVTRPLLGDRVLAYAAARYEAFDGQAFRSDLPSGAIVIASEAIVRGTAELRWSLTPDWTAGARYALFRESRLQNDYIAQVGSDITRSVHGIGLETARRITPSTRVAIGAGAAFHSGHGILPDPADTGPVYARLVAPELALYMAETRTSTLAATVQRTVSERLAVSAQVRYATLAAPDRSAAGGALPEGQRRSWTASVTLEWQR